MTVLFQLSSLIFHAFTVQNQTFISVLVSFSSKLNFVNENQILYNVFDMLKCQRETDLPFQCQI